MAWLETPVRPIEGECMDTSASSSRSTSRSECSVDSATANEVVFDTGSKVMGREFLP